MPKQVPEFIFVERVRRDVYCYAVDINEHLHDLEVTLVFNNGKLHEVKEPSVIDVRDQWRLRKVIAQMIENAENRLKDEMLPVVHPSNDGGLFQESQQFSDDEEEDEESLPKGTFPDTAHYKLDPQTVAEERRYWRDRRHRDLNLGSRAEHYNVTGTALANALLGVSWKKADEIEPPLTKAEYNNALAQPRTYA